MIPITVDFSALLGHYSTWRLIPVAIIGPRNSGMAHVLSHLANELHVPLLSFTALDPTISPLQYPYFIQTAPNDIFQMTAIAEMVSYFGYTEVTAVFSDDDQSRNATRDDIMNELVKVRLMESRVIVLHTYSETGLLVFDVAQSLGMMESGLPTLSKEFSLFSPHAPYSEKRRAFSSRWNKLSNRSIGLNPYGLYAYDTVWMIANAVKVFLDHGGTISFSNDSNLKGFMGRDSKSCCS
ncbi:hypothetical protein F0562_014340 [Nyssa sinensis]|uniref:Receptor ligand binding region domain-containing protein n=1 Tax=Nyssa sinensis TaxID=561372 RepID=A0A5J4ZQC9_9ASTE|nr:hypothetical protein F0562_014340 [Nyssa sinensis]